jgi:hypothetical protein
VCQLLLRAPPQLRVLNAPHLIVPAHEAEELPLLCRALRHEAPFGALRVPELTCSLVVGFDAHALFSLADAIAAHASLTGLTLLHTRLDAPGALDAAERAALARRSACLLARTAAEALARLLRSSAALTALSPWFFPTRTASRCC